MGTEVACLAEGADTMEAHEAAMAVVKLVVALADSQVARGGNKDAPAFLVAVRALADSGMAVAVVKVQVALEMEGHFPKGVAQSGEAGEAALG